MLPPILLLIPLFTALALMLLGGKMQRQIAIGSAGLTLAATLLALYQSHLGNLQLLQFNYHAPGINSLSLNISLPGVSLSLVTLTSLLYCVVVYFAKPEQESPGAFYGFLFLIQCGLNGFFMAHDIIMFYIFFEMGLVPAYFLISKWGSGENTGGVAFKFFAYTLVGSLLMLVALIYLYIHTGTHHSSDLAEIVNAGKNLAPALQWKLALLIFVAFAIKMPIFPFHTWQPGAYKAAPTVVTAILSGLMAKMGLYGILRLLLNVFPDGIFILQPYLITLAVVGVIYAAVLALQQDNLKTLLAYSSISHIGLMTAAVFSLEPVGIEGSVFQMFSHGIIVAGLLLMVEIIYRRTGTLSIASLGGIAARAPRMATCFMILVFAGIALPLTSGFIGEFMLLNAIFNYNFWLAAAAGTTVIIGAVYIYCACINM